MHSVYNSFCNTVGQYNANTFLHIPLVACHNYSSKDISFSYEELSQQVENTRAQYQATGYGIGNRIALVLENRPDFFIHWFALNALGASIVPINAEMQENEIQYLLEHSESCLVVTLDCHSDKISNCVNSLSNAPALLGTNLEGITDNTYSTNNTKPIDTATECALLYTSGSTGKPKGCVLSNEYFLTAGEWYQNLGGLCPLEAGQERLLTPLPLTHMNAMTCSAMAMMITGGCLIQLDRFHPSSWWQTVRDSQATIIHYLGVIPAILLNKDVEENETEHDVKFGFGAGINPTHHALFEQRFGFPLIEGWAMTESGCASAISANYEPRHPGTSCIGKPGKHIEIKIINENREAVTPGEPGELLVRAAGDKPRRGFFTEYLKNPEATAEVWQDGYLNTGDIVREADDGQLHFVDRSKNIIRRSGENISILEVEAIMQKHPIVVQLAVAAVYDEIRGEEVMALVVPASFNDANATVAEELFSYSMEHLAYYKTPGYISFVSELPLTVSQKPKRAEIKTLSNKLVGQDSCFDLRELKRQRKRAAS